MRLVGIYDEHHTHPINRVMHFIAIPLGFSSLVVVWFHPVIGLLLIPAGLGLAVLGHVIEGNQPAFIKDPKQVFVAPVWLLRTLLKKAAGSREQAKIGVEKNS
ncbi:MAG TPA: DUF962 domain-containing protein [Terriglobales bacterium]